MTATPNALTVFVWFACVVLIFGLGWSVGVAVVGQRAATPSTPGRPRSYSTREAFIAMAVARIGAPPASPLADAMAVLAGAHWDALTGFLDLLGPLGDQQRREMAEATHPAAGQVNLEL